MGIDLGREHWTATAERTSEGDFRILGEDENGTLLVPLHGMPGHWKGRYNPWNPRHWQFWLRSRITRRIAFVE
jgi:hypothetical protein